MSGIKDTATVTLNVNGAQAKQMMAEIESKIKQTEDAIDSMRKSMADPKDIEKAKKQLKTYKKQLDEMRSATEGVNRALENIELATPRELEKALRTLNRQLKDMVPGSEVWNSHTEKIRELKERLAELKVEVKEQKSTWAKFKEWAEDTWPAIDLIRQGYDSLVGSLRGYVDAYAEMQQEEANVRKFTGMTEADVRALNEEFKRMDTRTSREELNKLAQEAGRLGKQSLAEVLGYVRASDKINVALDDLGEGATLTLSKLTQIFGVEDMYGTENSLLKVGSVINELSQNCSASAPYLAEFASRMGGVGAQAGMTVQQIMGFAAVLDSNNQKVEASATALSQIITRLYQDPAKYAKVAGLDVKKFTDLLRQDANAALIEFLSALNNAGGMDVLSPMFKDMGETGSRAISALSTLAENIDAVRAQQEAANEAFREGTSIDQEFAVQNTTVQAELDKAKKGFKEMAVQLGEKLSPIMKHVISTTSALMKVLSVVIDFVFEHKTAIIALVGSIGMYNATIAVYNARTTIAGNVTKIWHGAIGMFKGVIPAVKLLVAGLTNTVQYFTKGLEVNYAMQQRWQTAMKGMKFANWVGVAVAAITALIVALDSLGKKTDEYDKIVDKAKAAASGHSEELMKEQHELDVLFGKLEGAEKGTEAYKSAKDEIIDKYGQYLGGLINEQGEISNLTLAYNRLTVAIRRASQERGIQAAREELDSQYYEDQAKYLRQLQENLEYWTGDAKRAARLTTKVAEALTSGKGLDQETYDLLTAISGQRTRDNAGFFDNVKAYVNTSIGAEWLQAGLGWTGFQFRDASPMDFVGNLWSAKSKYNAGVASFEGMLDGVSPLRHYDTNLLREGAFSAQYRSASGHGGYVLILDEGGRSAHYELISAEEAKALYDKYVEELAYRGESLEKKKTNPEKDPEKDPYTPTESEKDRKKREAEERRAKIKAKQEFKDALDTVKAEWEQADATNTTNYALGLESWADYLKEKYRLELKYYDDREKVYKDHGLEEDEDFQELMKKRAEFLMKWSQKNATLTVSEAKRWQAEEELKVQKMYYDRDSEIYHNEEALQQALFDIRIEALKKMQSAYHKTSEEWHNYQVQIDQAEGAEQLRRKKLMAERIAEWRKKYEYQDAKSRLDLELSILDEAHEKGLVSEEEYKQAMADLKRKYAEQYMPSSGKLADDPEKQKEEDLKILESLYKQGLIDEEEYNKRKAAIEKRYSDMAIAGVRKFGSEQTNQLLDIYEAWKNFFDATEEDGGNWATRLAALASAVFAVMNAGMESASSFIKTQADLDVARAEKKYAREIELAEGNSYKTKKLEKQREADIAKIKNDANKKMFSMQIIQAVAQNATNALNAYGSAAAIPVVGHILAPIAAAMAIAAGAVQIATIKKQQQAAEAQGYSAGGFTKPGRVDEPAGIVHAGEWVASQKLLANPVARPMIEALDYAQRTNTIGSLRAEDVSRSITANNSLVRIAENNDGTMAMIAVANKMSGAVSDLTDRLNEPFVTVNTVTGSKGIKSAQDEYDRLMSNKSPKSKRNGSNH